MPRSFPADDHCAPRIEHGIGALLAPGWKPGELAQIEKAKPAAGPDGTMISTVRSGFDVWLAALEDDARVQPRRIAEQLERRMPFSLRL